MKTKVNTKTTKNIPKKTLKKKKLKKVNLQHKKKSTTKKNVDKNEIKLNDSYNIKVSAVSNKTIKKKRKKKYSINFYRFIISLSIFISISLGLYMYQIVSKVDITEDTNISTIDAKKNAKQILEVYNTKEAKEKFLETYEEIQECLNIYVFDGISEEEVEGRISGINKELETKVWSTLNLRKPTFFNGTWYVDSKKVLKFKFTNKKIEPDWIFDEDVSDKIVSNS